MVVFFLCVFWLVGVFFVLFYFPLGSIELADKSNFPFLRFIKVCFSWQLFFHPSVNS